MASERAKFGMTMVEVLIAVVILALLVAGIFFVSTNVRTQAKVQVTQSLIATLDTALQQYYDQTHSYPPDCNDIWMEMYIEDALKGIGGKNVVITPFEAPAALIAKSYPNYHPIAVMYYCLGVSPSSKQVLAKISDPLLIATAALTPPDTLTIAVDGRPYPYFRVIDPWKMPLRYSRRGAANFPKIESAGPDMKFDTTDDIINKKN